MNSPASLFQFLNPDKIISAAEAFTGKSMDGSLTPYNSYVNRVFGLTDEEGRDYIIKFYRSGRWSKEQILEEHDFLLDCQKSEIPVVAPLKNQSDDESTLSVSEDGLFYTVFPRLRARTFDIYSQEDWIRTGRAIGRLHRTAAQRPAPHRLQCSSFQTTEPYIRLLLSKHLITPEEEGTFMDICDQALDYIEYAWEKCFGKADAEGLYHTSLFTRIHGDCHRGNILEQFISPSPAKVTGKAGADSSASEQSIITLIDFDDMMTGPAIQDLWLLLPNYRSESTREFNLLVQGYEEFAPEELSSSLFSQRRLIEPLRFMRNIYFLAWTAIQHDDPGFEERNPGWGSKAFWEKEIQDLNQQLQVLRDEYDFFEAGY